ncbi:MAG TPA: hypothetical protein VFC19_29610 [Candidatus Limnocylindrales bacterium]|nr:hypothetical protein [Candidatus Limnocylindrales bacterium]
MKLWDSKLFAATDSPGVERTAYVFYAVAALGSSIGQIWVGVDTAPWPETLPSVWRIAIVVPFAIVIDLGGVVAAAFADWRQRLGEAAYGWRVLSAASVSIGVAINVIGHIRMPYLAVVFGGLGTFAYCVWLMHSAARRRDALRKDGKLAATAPVYGIGQWRREPTLTRLARNLALQNGYGLHESLERARQQLRDRARDTALLAHVNRYVTEQHEDPILASIAVTAVDTDALAAKVRDGLDVDAIAVGILAQLNPLTPDVGVLDIGDDNEEINTDAADAETASRVPDVPFDVVRELPSKQADVERYRDLWIKLQADSDLSDADFADRHGISLRTLQRIRRVGNHGLLDIPHQHAQ